MNHLHHFSAPPKAPPGVPGFTVRITKTGEVLYRLGWLDARYREWELLRLHGPQIGLYAESDQGSGANPVVGWTAEGWPIIRTREGERLLADPVPT